MTKLRYSAWSVLLLITSMLQAEERTLTDQFGRSITADVLELDGDTLKIRRADGIVFDLPIGNLSDADQTAIREWSAKQPQKVEVVVEVSTQNSNNVSKLVSPKASQRVRDVCSTPNAANLLYAPDFEQSSIRWVFPNQEKAFKRVSANEALAIPLSPDLGNTVMLLKTTSAGNYDGPPFITQEFRVSGRPAKLMVCCDLAYVGTPDHKGGVRLSFTDPGLRYTEGSGLRFPFTQIRVPEPSQWKHVEWTADVSDIKNRKIVVGLMFPYSSGNWYIDNVRVTRVDD